MAQPLTLRLAVDGVAPYLARTWIVDALGLAGHVADDVRILTHEVVSNVVQHAGLAVDALLVLCVVPLGQERLRVEVCDEGGRFGRPPTDVERSAPTSGLQILERLSADWGVEHDGTTRIWFVYDPATAPPWPAGAG